ncbi:hypothetical protein RND81_14G028900 [Saponaria officinalis]|uniref:Plant bHLH transcription factor ACT-like domain-containing protein n=1 Tax=Saponaria officinalis TaxID=3572 RepID=A0AAW1GTN6_SAPOF
MDSQNSDTGDETVVGGEEMEDDSSANYALPHVEVKVSNNTLLLRLHCESKKGILPKIFSQVEGYDLTIVNSSVMAFGDTALDITIVAEIQNDSSTILKDLVASLHSIL